MKLCASLTMAVATIAIASKNVRAFSVALNKAFVPVKSSLNSNVGGMSDELGIPCEEECALEAYPNLPATVHPGVLSGQAMLDLLEDAKTKGESFFKKMVNYQETEDITLSVSKKLSALCFSDF